MLCDGEQDTLLLWDPVVFTDEGVFIHQGAGPLLVTDGGYGLCTEKQGKET